jgi:hypothetical protein
MSLTASATENLPPVILGTSWMLSPQTSEIRPSDWVNSCQRRDMRRDEDTTTAEQEKWKNERQMTTVEISHHTREDGERIGGTGNRRTDSASRKEAQPQQSTSVLKSCAPTVSSQACDSAERRAKHADLRTSSRSSWFIGTAPHAHTEETAPSDARPQSNNEREKLWSRDLPL